MSSTDLSPFSSREIASKKRVLLFHWFVCSVGLVGIIYGLSWKLHAVLLIGRPMTKYNQWAIPFFFPNKPQQLIFFIATGIGLFLYYFVVYYVMNKRDEGISATYNIADLSCKGSILLYLLLPLTINAIVAAYFPSAPPSAHSYVSLCIDCFVVERSIVAVLSPVHSAQEKVMAHQGEVLAGYGKDKSILARTGLLVGCCRSSHSLLCSTSHDVSSLLTWRAPDDE